MSFWYYLPQKTAADITKDGGKRLSRVALEVAGLAEILADVREVPKHAVLISTGNGPDRGPGVAIVPLPVSGEVPKPLKIDAASWRPPTGAGITWLGWLSHSPPQPDDLLRRELVDGLEMTDGHERPWTIPLLRAVTNPRGRLPWCADWDDEDRPRFAVDPRYQALWADSGRVWDLVAGKASDPMGGVIGRDFTPDEDAWLADYVVRCLRINYRVSHRELAQMQRLQPGFLPQSVLSLFLNASVDFFLYRAAMDAQKKTRSSAVPAGPSVPPGPGA